MIIDVLELKNYYFENLISKAALKTFSYYDLTDETIISLIFYCVFSVIRISLFQHRLTIDELKLLNLQRAEDNNIKSLTLSYSSLDDLMDIWNECCPSIKAEEKEDWLIIWEQGFTSYLLATPVLDINNLLKDIISIIERNLSFTENQKRKTHLSLRRFVDIL